MFKRLLVVVDDPLMLNLTVEQLEVGCAVEVISAKSAEEAVEIISRE